MSNGDLPAVLVLIGFLMMLILLVVGLAVSQNNQMQHNQSYHPIQTGEIDNRIAGIFSDDNISNLPPAAPMPHALKALKAAHTGQYTFSDSLLTDIGFIASWDTVTAHTYRTTPIPDSAHAIQPYAQLRLRHSGLWHIMFEIYDSGGMLLFQRENETYLEQGRHLVMPPARLRLYKELRVGTWTLTVRVNGALLAQHRFTWSADLVDGFIESDGEIDEEYLHRIEDLSARPLSMDELLSMPTSHTKPRSLPP